MNEKGIKSFSSKYIEPILKALPKEVLMTYLLQEQARRHIPGTPQDNQ